MSQPVRRLLWGLVVLVILIGGALWFLDRTLGSGMCQTTVYSEAKSLGDDDVARVQMTDCGATTGFSRVVMLEKPGLWKRECRALALKGSPNVNLVWRGDTLQISHTASASDVIAQNHECFGHSIKIVQDQ